MQSTKLILDSLFRLLPAVWNWIKSNLLHILYVMSRCFWWWLLSGQLLALSLSCQQCYYGQECRDHHYHPLHLWCHLWKLEQLIWKLKNTKFSLIKKYLTTGCSKIISQYILGHPVVDDDLRIVEVPLVVVDEAQDNMDENLVNQMLIHCLCWK